MRALGAWMFAMLGFVAAGCTGDDDDDDNGPTGAYPCDHPDEWPETLESALHPFTVHYELATDEAMAIEVAGFLNTSWGIEFGQLGFDLPPSDGGACGADDRFDVFLWRGEEQCYIDVFADVPGTEWADQVPYMVVDPWGPYGGPILDSTLAHELNHAAQAAYDWDEPLLIFEMTSTFMEDVVFDDDDEYRDLLHDFQAYPDWSIDSSEAPGDNFFLYGSALYLFYIRDRHFAGDPAFTVQLWGLSRSPAGEANEPDFEDALETILQDASGMSFHDSVAEFARWRWYTGTRDDGVHFEEGADFPANATVAFAVSTAGSIVAVSPEPMMLGSSYLEISRGGGGTTPVDVSLASPDPGVIWVVQAVPGIGGGDGDVVDVTGGPVPVELTPGGTRTLVLTALPAGPYDPDERTGDRYPVTITLGP